MFAFSSCSSSLNRDIVLIKYKRPCLILQSSHEWSHFTTTHNSKIYYVYFNFGPGYFSRYSDFLRAGRCGDRIPVGGEIFRIRSVRPWDPPNLLYNGYRLSFPGIKRPGRGVDHAPHLALRLRKSTAIPLLPLWAFVACSRAIFTFTFIF